MAKSTFVMFFLLGIVCISFAQQISPKFNQANISAVLSNERVLTNYIKCLLGEQKCTRDGRSLKGKEMYYVEVFLFLIILSREKLSFFDKKRSDSSLLNT